MEPTVGGHGYFLAAVLLGVTHGIEPDHLAGIVALTHEAGDAKRSALVGGCFGAGHAALVILWIILAFVLFGSTAIPPVVEQFGTLFVGVTLSLLGLYLGITGTRRFVHEHRHDHGDQSHTHYHVHVPSVIRPSAFDTGVNHGEHEHKHGVVRFFKVGSVGALFTLSPPLSMIAFMSITMGRSGGALIIGVVAVYTVVIITTMALIGGGSGSLFRFSKSRGVRLHSIYQIVASVLVLAIALNLMIGHSPNLLA